MPAPVQTGERFDRGLVRVPLYVPPYLYPDAFPVVSGSKCLCGPRGTDKAMKALLPGSQSGSDKLTGEELESLYRAYGKEKVQQYLNKAAATASHHHCVCKENTDGGYRYERAVPVFNSSKYILEPADATYGAGNYWQPTPKGGIVAPAERLPIKGYPLQASADELRLLPAASIEDRIDTRFA